MAILVVAGAISGEAHSDASFTDAIALGCYLPLPAHYRFNTREREHFTWFSSDPMESGRIDIIDGGEIPLAEFDVLDRRQEGHLLVLRLRFKEREGKSSLPSPYNEVVAISGADQRAMLSGDAKSYADQMIAGCLANPAPGSPSNRGLQLPPDS